MRQKTDKLFEMQEIMRNFVVYLRLSDILSYRQQNNQNNTKKR